MYQGYMPQPTFLFLLFLLEPAINICSKHPKCMIFSNQPVSEHKTYVIELKDYNLLGQIRSFSFCSPSSFSQFQSLFYFLLWTPTVVRLNFQTDLRHFFGAFCFLNKKLFFHAFHESTTK